MSLSAKRSAISAFLILHISAVVLTNLPGCAVRRSLSRVWMDAYLLPTGLWQVWGMFAPEPAKDTVTLEAVIRDSRGLVRNYVFPRQMDESVWNCFFGGYRHAKYAHNLSMTDSVATREFAARFVARAAKLKPEDFPADVQLVYQVWPTPPLDPKPDQAPVSPWTSVLETYHFPNIEETKP
jgi:hypothetical protein